jgi:hypothetical protein
MTRAVPHSNAIAVNGAAGEVARIPNQMAQLNHTSLSENNSVDHPLS